eukprot:TRINITY_DN19732_c1_g1_i2.p2 TRINITY_DN19732_c1_g1~~TRINITY_DN19732_c1_g1_i2.p2  ORF type:complete len:230 (-),score=-13.46 TRINITY_DN19732_c1_g1_i2:101-790(-)
MLITIFQPFKTRYLKKNNSPIKRLYTKIYQFYGIFLLFIDTFQQKIQKNMEFCILFQQKLPTIALGSYTQPLNQGAPQTGKQSNICNYNLYNNIQQRMQMGILLQNQLSVGHMFALVVLTFIRYQSRMTVEAEHPYIFTNIICYSDGGGVSVIFILQFSYLLTMNFDNLFCSFFVFYCLAQLTKIFIFYLLASLFGDKSFDQKKENCLRFDVGKNSVKTATYFIALLSF